MRITAKKLVALALTGILSCTAMWGCNKKGDNGTATTTEAGATEGTATAAKETEDNKSDGRISADYIINANLSALGEDSDISDTLYGLFFEDINFAVDAGLYAELVKNRSFEYGSAASNANKHGWRVSNAVDFKVVDGTADSTYLNAANVNYAVLTNTSDNYVGIGNGGYLDGLAVAEGASYKVTFFMKGSGYTGDVKVSLRGTDGTVYAENNVTGIKDEWYKYETTLVPNKTVNKNLILYIEIQKGSVCVDMISMMPVDTYKGLSIRKDLGEALEALKPQFIRFPGGCVIEGRSLETMYSWKDSIGDAMEFVINGKTTVGDVAVRPQGEDIWIGNSANPYYTTYGIGFYEYFLLCEALDAMPVPVLNAGMTCAIQSPKYIVHSTKSEEFKQCVQDALDLVEFCLGDETTKWGAVRIAMGHKEPFELKYVGIGNEQWQAEYHTHYELFVEAFENAAKERPELYGNIELIVANGTTSSSTEGWTYIKRNPDEITTLVDEHYYNTPEWFFKNNKRYDSYDRTRQAAVFLGEYAAKSNTMRAALAEASYMTGIERNADLIKMAAYAPLFGNSTLNQWTPDMMFFSNDDILFTANYYVQQMFANNVGTNILTSELTAEEFTASSSSLNGRIGLGSWMTSVAYDNLKVVSNDTGAVLYETDFSAEDVLTKDKWAKHKGMWKISDGMLVQTNTGSPADGNTGDAIYVGDTSWSNYTMTIDAQVLSGAEGFLIPVCVRGTDNNIFWNIGGWGNTVSCLQIVENGAKSDQVTGTTKNIKLKYNSVYKLKVVVNGANIKCYINDQLYVNYTQENPSELYETASVDANGDIIIKMVNPTECPADINVTLKDIDMSKYNAEASVITLAGEYLSDANSFDNQDLIVPKDSSITVSEQFTYTLPKYSVSIIRISAKN